MGSPSVPTIKRLFAVSGNRCAFQPSCATSIVDHESGVVIGEVCHILGRSGGGPRHDPAQSEEARHSFENLVLLCDPHHKIVDQRVDLYPPERLYAFKAAHEAEVRAAGQKAPEDVERRFIDEYTRVLRPYVDARLVLDSLDQNQRTTYRLDLTNTGAVLASGVSFTMQIASFSQAGGNQPTRSILPGGVISVHSLPVGFDLRPGQEDARLFLNYSALVFGEDRYFESVFRFVFPTNRIRVGEAIHPMTATHEEGATASGVAEQVRAKQITDGLAQPEGTVTFIYFADHSFRMVGGLKSIHYTPAEEIVEFRLGSHILAMKPRPSPTRQHRLVIRWKGTEGDLWVDGVQVKSPGYVSS
jgi:hypothetical protein